MAKIKNEGFVKGAVVGGLVGSAAGLLLAPKSGKDLRCDITDTCLGRTHDLKNAISNTGHSIKDKIRGSVEETEDLLNDDNSDVQDFVTGGIIGALLGVTAAVLLAPKKGKELRKDLIETYENVKESAEEIGDDVINFAKKSGKGSSVDDFLELAKVGLKAWNNLQKRK